MESGKDNAALLEPRRCIVSIAVLSTSYYPLVVLRILGVEDSSFSHIQSNCLYSVVHHTDWINMAASQSGLELPSSAETVSVSLIDTCGF